MRASVCCSVRQIEEAFYCIRMPAFSSKCRRDSNLTKPNRVLILRPCQSFVTSPHEYLRFCFVSLSAPNILLARNVCCYDLKFQYRCSCRSSLGVTLIDDRTMASHPISLADLGPSVVTNKEDYQIPDGARYDYETSPCGPGLLFPV